VEHGTLQHPLEAKCGLRLTAVFRRKPGCGFFEESANFLLELLDVAAAGAQHLDGRRVAQQGIEQVLDCHELVVVLASFLEGQVQRKFKFLAQHVGTSRGRLDFFHRTQQRMLVAL
jgi:hypothetical protein